MDQVTAYHNAMKVLWQSLVPASWNPSFGFETSWMNNYLDWGFPLDVQEIAVTVAGKQYQGIHFHKVGLIVWDPATGPKVIGAPA